MTFITYRKLRRLSYTKHRYANLMLRLFLLPCFIDVVIVTVFAETFMTLYVTTLLLPLFLSFVHLPPGEYVPFPIVRRRRRVLDEYNESVPLFFPPRGGAMRGAALLGGGALSPFHSQEGAQGRGGSNARSDARSDAESERG